MNDDRVSAAFLDSIPGSQRKRGSRSHRVFDFPRGRWGGKRWIEISPVQANAKYAKAYLYEESMMGGVNEQDDNRISAKLYTRQQVIDLLLIFGETEHTPSVRSLTEDKSSDA